LEGRGLCPDHAPRMPPHLRLLMVSAMAAAGKFNAKVLQTLMGHSSITVTFDRCAHLMPRPSHACTRALRRDLLVRPSGHGALGRSDAQLPGAPPWVAEYRDPWRDRLPYLTSGLAVLCLGDPGTDAARLLVV
jgi:hypothetical protein